VCFSVWVRLELQSGQQGGFLGVERGRLPALANNAKHKTHFTVASDTIGVNLNCLMFEQEKATKQKQQQQLMS